MDKRLRNLLKAHGPKTGWHVFYVSADVAPEEHYKGYVALTLDEVVKSAANDGYRATDVTGNGVSFEK